MPRWQGKSRGNALGYRIFVVICKTLGLAPAYLLLRFVAFYYFLFSWQSSRHSFAYFHERLKYSRIKAKWSVFRNYYVFGQTLIDKIVVMAGLPNRFTYTFEGEENLHAMVHGGRGGMLISAHVGNWEAAGHLLKRLDTRINVVMYDAEHQRIKHYLEEVTGGRNFNVIVIREDLSHVYAISEALQKNELICLHADRFLEGNKTEIRTFLGAGAHFPSGPFALAAGFRVPVSMVFAFKETSTHYHFFGSAPIERRADENKAQFTTRLLDTFVADLEQKVKLYPEQWFNYYNFWAD